MYKHLTPQEISEFDEQIGLVFDNLYGDLGDDKTEQVLSFIDTLIGKRVGEIAERVEDVLEDYFLGQYPIPDAKVIAGYLREALSPDSPKRNEEHDHPSQ